ncbi:hypothetical protein [Lysinibacillus capsici]|uniref:hypothetical protein n=1 Tax=Lysinibacillus capsici TaxID=2115968 RepID=UPI000E201C2D|nr:hypothetical protein [Lysinibacillus capsici]RDV27792.1 hypothetical protein C7B89_19635 [Lysinibacillus capsici]
MTVLGRKANPYNKTVWYDQIKDVTTGQIIQEGTRFNQKRANNIEDGIYDAYEYIIQLESTVKRLQAQLDIDGRAPGNGGSFFDAFDGTPSRMVLDKALTDIIETVEIGTTTLKVASVEGFTAFTQVTIFDDVATEDVVITEVGTNTIKVQALKNAYKKGAKLARSNVDIDYINAEMGVGDWQTFNVELVEVV